MLSALSSCAPSYCPYSIGLGSVVASVRPLLGLGRIFPFFMPRRVFHVKKRIVNFVIVNIHDCVSGSGLASYDASSESVSGNMAVPRMMRFLRSIY